MSVYRTSDTGAVALSIDIGRLSLWARIWLPDAEYVLQHRIKLQAEIDAYNEVVQKKGG